MSKNDITGDRLVSKQVTEAYREQHDKIFGKKDKPKPKAHFCVVCMTSSEHCKCKCS